MAANMKIIRLEQVVLHKNRNARDCQVIVSRPASCPTVLKQDCQLVLSGHPKPLACQQPKQIQLINANGCFGGSNGTLAVCGMCRTPYSREKRPPKTLSCSHTFCLVCLMEWLTGDLKRFDAQLAKKVQLQKQSKQLRQQQQIPCPTCNVMTLVSKSDLNALPNNKGLLTLMDNSPKAIACNGQQSVPASSSLTVQTPDMNRNRLYPVLDDSCLSQAVVNHRDTIIQPPESAFVNIKVTPVRSSAAPAQRVTSSYPQPTMQFQSNTYQPQMTVQPEQQMVMQTVNRCIEDSARNGNVQVFINSQPTNSFGGSGGIQTTIPVQPESSGVQRIYASSQNFSQPSSSRPATNNYTNNNSTRVNVSSKEEEARGYMNRGSSSYQLDQMASVNLPPFNPDTTATSSREELDRPPPYNPDSYLRGGMMAAPTAPPEYSLTEAAYTTSESLYPVLEIERAQTASVPPQIQLAERQTAGAPPEVQQKPIKGILKRFQAADNNPATTVVRSTPDLQVDQTGTACNLTTGRSSSMANVTNSSGNSGLDLTTAPTFSGLQLLGFFGNYSDDRLKQDHFKQPTKLQLCRLTGDLLAVDSQYMTVHIFNPQGRSLALFRVLGVKGACLFGEIRVLAATHRCVQVYDRSGNKLQDIDVGASVNVIPYSGGFIVCQPQKLVFFSPTMAKEKELKYLTSGRFNQQKHKFKQLRDVTVSRDESLIIALDADCLLGFDSNGTLLFATKLAGQNFGNLRNPEAIAVDPAGNILVSDTENRRMVTFGPNGSYANAYSLEGQANNCKPTSVLPYGIAADSDGCCFVALAGESFAQIQKYKLQ